MIAEGSKVAYAGDDPSQDVGAIGRVLSVAGSDSVYVRWEGGPKRAQVEPVWVSDLVESQRIGTSALVTTSSVAESFDMGLEFAGAPGLQVRAVYDEQGEDGLVTALNEGGRLAPMAEHCEEAMNLLASRIRTDPMMMEVLAHLEGDEAQSLIVRVAGLLLSDQLSEES